MPELAVIVPSRGRPGNIRKVISAWDFTNAWDHADLVVAVDEDDPQIQGYRDLFEEHRHPDTGEQLFSLVVRGVWAPMVYKLNTVAVGLAESRLYFALGFAGDDHLPQTIGWAARYLTVLHELGTGMVYGNDGYQGAKLSTEWAITADVVRYLGGMVPAPVEHMYCDNSMMDLFDGAGAIRHLPEVVIEHMHPIAGKAPTDHQYKAVNSRDQFRRDRLAYDGWRRKGLDRDVAHVRDLRPGRPEFHLAPARPPLEPKTMKPSAQPMRSGPSRKRMDASMARFPFSQEFKYVRGATPDEIGMALADFATQVPADQEIVELGVFNGRTALILAWGAAQGNGAHVTAVDPWDLPGNVYDPPFTDTDSAARAQYNVRTLGYSERIELVQAFSEDVGTDWSGRPVGLLFVDGDHTREGARRDILAWSANLAPGAIIAVDDYGHEDWPGVAEAVDELVAEGVLEPLEIFHDRLAVTRLVADPDPSRVTAITSEGASPAPVAPSPELSDEERTTLEDEWRKVDPEGVAALEASAAELDTQESRRAHVQEGELEDVAAGTGIEALTIPQLKTLAKVREIVLGARKDKRSAIILALLEGK